MKASRVQIISRVAAGVFGGYAFTWGFVTLGILLLMAAGLSYGDAGTLLSLLAFIVLLTAFCWAFVAASLRRVWVVLAGGGGVMTAIAWWLARSIH